MKKLVQLFTVIGITLTVSAYAQKPMPASEKGTYISQGEETGQGRFAVNHFHQLKVKPQSDEFWLKYPGTNLELGNHFKLKPMLVLVSRESPSDMDMLFPTSPPNKSNYSAKTARELQKLGLNK